MSLVNIEKQGHILKIGLNRPEKMNAMNRAMYHEIAAAYYQLQNDPELRVAVMTPKVTTSPAACNWTTGPAYSLTVRVSNPVKVNLIRSISQARDLPSR